MTAKDCPYQTANWLSRLTFSWPWQVIMRGHRETLTSEHVHTTLDADKSQYLAEQLLRCMKEQEVTHQSTSLIKCLLKIHKWRFTLAIVLFLIMEGLRIIQPFLIAILVQYFHQDEAVSSNTAYIAGFFLCFNAFALSTINASLFFNTQHLAMKIKVAAGALIFRKMLQLRTSDMSKVGSGHILNLLATDVEKFNLGLQYFVDLFVPWISFMVIIGLLVSEMGASIAMGVVFTVIVIPILMCMGAAVGKMRYKVATKTDKRVHLMDEIISVKKVIKMYCWEAPLGKYIKELRRDEMRALKNSHLTRLQLEGITSISNKLALFVILLAHWGFGNQLSVSQGLKLIGWMGHLQYAVYTFFPWSFVMNAELLATTRRIERFLYLKTTDPAFPIKNTKYDSNKTTTTNAAVALHKMSAHWEEVKANKFSITHTPHDLMKTFTLDSIDFTLQKGELVAIVGAVGAGKTSLLMCVLNEMLCSSGAVHVEGRSMYVPQEPWVFTGTVRDNILFGKPLAIERYKAALHVSSLLQDISIMPYGDLTLVGERGLALSGGQKARINLARCIYRDGDVYILDDPLSAVDAKVGREIFNNCIVGMLKGKCRILVTHQIQYVKEVDRVIVMDKGSVIADGSYEDVCDKVEICNMLMVENKDGYDDQVYCVDEEDKQAINRKHNVLSTTADPSLIEEENSTGSVSWACISSYIRSGQGAILLPLYLILSAVRQSAFFLCDWWISLWIDGYDKSNRTSFGVNYTYDGNLTTADTDTPSIEEELSQIWIYLGLIACLLVSVGIKQYVYCCFTVKASRGLHDNMFQKLMRAPMWFFHKHPVGSILNRFSRDLGFVDDGLATVSGQVLVLLTQLLGAVVFVCVTNYVAIVAVIPFLIGVVVFYRYSVPAMRDIKRIEAAARSPVYSYISSSLEGLQVIRAFHMEKDTVKHFDEAQDKQTAAWFLFISVYRCIGMRIDYGVSVFLTCLCIISFLVTKTETEATLIAIGLVYIIMFLDVLQYAIMEIMHLESYMVSLERVYQYCKLPQEAAAHTQYKVPKEWPQYGRIQLNDVSLRYSDEGIPALDRINIFMQPSEKIGIVGRTGAGKSSIITSLLRLTEPSGEIIIDGVNILKIGLTDSRQCISVIPQEHPLHVKHFLEYRFPTRKNQS